MPSAGDVERFAYCPRNWYLAQQGVQGLDGPGGAFHDAIGKAQADVEAGKADYRQAMRWSFRALAAAGSVTLLALELTYLRAHPQHLVFLVLALVIVSASSGLMVLALHAQHRYREEQVSAGLVPGHLQDTDLVGDAELLEDPEWGLSGRPDYVLSTQEGPVPVEVKSAKAPATPHDSHRLQVGVYLRLLEANGRDPPYGIIQYRDGLFRVAWNDEARGALRDVLRRIAAGESDRDHQHAARCRGCARRRECDQRLA